MSEPDYAPDFLTRAIQTLDEMVQEEMQDIILSLRLFEWVQNGEFTASELRAAVVAVMCELMSDKDEMDTAKACGVSETRLASIRKKPAYKRLREAVIATMDSLADPVAYQDHKQNLQVQDRVFRRQFRMAMTSKDPRAVPKLLETMSEQVSPRRSEDIATFLMISESQFGLIPETLKMVEEMKRKQKGQEEPLGLPPPDSD